MYETEVNSHYRLISQTTVVCQRDELFAATSKVNWSYFRRKETQAKKSFQITHLQPVECCDKNDFDEVRTCRFRNNSWEDSNADREICRAKVQRGPNPVNYQAKFESKKRRKVRLRRQTECMRGLEHLGYKESGNDQGAGQGFNIQITRHGWNQPDDYQSVNTGSKTNISQGITPVTKKAGNTVD